MSNFAISAQAVWALGLVASPILVVHPASGLLVWANTAAVTYFNSQSIEQLQRQHSDDPSSGIAVMLRACFSALAQAAAPLAARIALQNGIVLTPIAFTIEADTYNSVDAIMIEIRPAAITGTVTSTKVSDTLAANGPDLALHEFAAVITRDTDVNTRQLRMLKIASHEFRTPLAVIDGAAQRISRRVGKDAPEQIIALAERIRVFVDRLGSLLDHTIERAKTNSTQIECKPTQGFLQHAVMQIAHLFDGQADIEIADEVNNLPLLWFDQLLIEHALMNIIGNAIKYSGGSPRIRFSASNDDGYLFLYVRDFGIGISPEESTRVFEQHFRGRDVGERAGSGLGLYIVGSIVRAHKGTISVEQPDGPGTILKVALPLHPALGHPDTPDGKLE